MYFAHFFSCCFVCFLRILNNKAWLWFELLALTTMEDLSVNVLGGNCKIQHSCSAISWQTCFSSLTSSRWKPSVSHPRNVAWKKSRTLCTSFILASTQWVVNPSSRACRSMSKTNGSPGFSHLLTWKNTLYEGLQQSLGKQSTASQIDSCLSWKHPDVGTKPWYRNNSTAGENRNLFYI